MTAEELAAIKERLAKATPGPWGFSDLPYNGMDDPIIHSEGAGGMYVAQTVYDMQSVTQKHNVEADTLLIAHAPTDIASLIAALEAQQRAVEAARREARVAALEEAARAVCTYCREEAENVRNRKLWVWSDFYVHGIDPRGYSDNPLFQDEYYGGYDYCTADAIHKLIAAEQGQGERKVGDSE